MRLLWIALLLTAATGCVKRFSLVEAPIDKSWTSPQVVRFSASPQVIHHGETAVLTWSVRNVSRVMLEEALEPDGSLSDRYLHSIGDFAANGTVSVSPKTSATYVLSCGPQTESGLGCVSASVSVVVK
ncbi:MAG: hypothetical protein ABSE86_00020 [Bryobacteraceae bacterium]|jgi:hypothetical protein